MRIPSIHMNGTSRSEIVESLLTSQRALMAAAETLYRPNARDFYVQGETAFNEAQREFEARMSKLTEVRREIESMLEEVCE